MPTTCCCVPQCSGRGGHTFPRDKQRLRDWLIAIKRDKWKPSPTSVVCREHFKPSDYSTETSLGHKRMLRVLKADAVPSVFAWTTQPSPVAVQRGDRLQRRRQAKVSSDSLLSSSPQFHRREEVPTVGANVEIGPAADSTPTERTGVSDADPTPSVSHAETQTADSPPFDINNFMCDAVGLHYYTGLENYEKFMYVLSTLGHSAYHLTYYRYQCEKLSVPNQFFLTLIKLRVHPPNFQLSRMFAIAEASVSNIFITWINFMARQWGELSIFPDRELTTFYMPDDFQRTFPSTRLIIDGMECPIKKPKNPVIQQATFSTYKNMNTVKTVVGSTPGGLLSFISPTYGGNTSDRQIVERSNLGSMCDPGDSIMADKGFNIQDLMAPSDVHVNLPTFLRKGNRFSPNTLSKDRKIASKRVHIERHIGLGKTYKILCHAMTPRIAALSSEITFVCFMLCNFRSCIVPQTA